MDPVAAIADSQRPKVERGRPDRRGSSRRETLDDVCAGPRGSEQQRPERHDPVWSSGEEDGRPGEQVQDPERDHDHDEADPAAIGTKRHHAKDRHEDGRRMDVPVGENRDFDLHPERFGSKSPSLLDGRHDNPPHQ